MVLEAADLLYWENQRLKKKKTVAKTVRTDCDPFLIYHHLMVLCYLEIYMGEANVYKEG